MTNKRVLVGFSGGVDSCLTALLLRERGWEVTAAMMSVRGDSGSGCGQKEDIPAARALAESVGVPFLAVDCSRAYQTEVLGYFRDEYLAGRTPNPCVRCNPLVKFGLLPELARKAGVDFAFFATGHYARIERSPGSGRPRLLRGRDHAKDQSYFLYRLAPEQLATTLFPLGDFEKMEVRRMAAERGIPVHDKPDSQDFYAGDYSELMGTEAREGEIVDAEGKFLGRHRGYWNFTPGQRKGLGIAYSEPLYVLRVEPASNRVVVGTRVQHMGEGCRIGNPVFHDAEPTPGTRLQGRMRSSQPPHWMTIGEKLPDGTLPVRFDSPQHGVAPGQSLVFYDGDTVVGGGIIEV